ncbi:MAG: hypothetical protein LBE82_11055 [Chitinophagaceae bacterium]|jgi:glucose-6-phosphate-specific signal transduction histidine kinase|nr:hypothetical protein [Chitinophagaceae bacterium]
MSVTLRKRKNADGAISLRLDIYRNGKRTIETLKHLQLANPTTTAIRDTNKELLAQAKVIAVAKAMELESNNYNKNIRVTTWICLCGGRYSYHIKSFIS